MRISATGAEFLADIQEYTMQGLQYHYVIRDHLGSPRVVFNDKNNNGTVDAGEVEDVKNFYLFGLEWDETPTDQVDQYRRSFTGQERVSHTNILEYQYRCLLKGAGVWDGPDPLSDQYTSIATGAYSGNNPVRYVDHDGRAPADPLDDYYNQNGDFLYHDNQITDNIRIISSSDWASIQSTYSEQLADRSRSDLGLIQALDANSTIVNEANISAEAWSKITTYILSSMDDVDVSKLYNGKVSVLNYHTAGAKAKFNDPTNFASVANVDPKTLRETGDIKLTVYLWGGSADSELRTVSNVKNTLGAHEYLGHGVKKYSDRTGTHHKAYELQMNHPSWQGTTRDFKKFQTEKYNEYKSREKR